jgi:hypothetical protein
MTHKRPEINHWLLEKGYSQGEVEKILAALDDYDQHTHRESLFEDLSSGDFDIGPIIDAALKEE